MPKKNNLCDRIIEASRDEGAATIDYGRLAEELAERPEPELNSLSILLKKLSQDEQSHKVALQSVAKLVCPAEAISRLRG